MKQKLIKFFEEYEAAFNRSLGDAPDIDSVTKAFADCFIDDHQLRNVIAQGYQFYKSVGTRQVKIASMDVTPLDEYHSMAKVYYQSIYGKKDGEEVSVDFSIIYLIQIIEDEPKIFGYISGDEQKLLKKKEW